MGIFSSYFDSCLCDIVDQILSSLHWTRCSQVHTPEYSHHHTSHTHTHPLQWNVIGQNLADITDEDDLPTITKNLQSSTTPPSTHLDCRTELQHRQFFVRIKSSLTPGQCHVSVFALSPTHNHTRTHACTHLHSTSTATPSHHTHNLSCHTTICGRVVTWTYHCTVTHI